MYFIAHRGNVFGPNKERENSPEYVKEALALGYDAEIDVWVVDDMLWSGHDQPQYALKLDFLLENRKNLWCHAKNLEALNLLMHAGLHCFVHDKDDYTLTSLGVIWAYPGRAVDETCVMVMPEYVWHLGVYNDNDLKRVKGVCTDYAGLYKEKFES